MWVHVFGASTTRQRCASVSVYKCGCVGVCVCVCACTCVRVYSRDSSSSVAARAAERRRNTERTLCSRRAVSVRLPQGARRDNMTLSTATRDPRRPKWEQHSPSFLIHPQISTTCEFLCSRSPQILT